MEAEEEAITHTLERRLEMVSQAWHTVTIAAAIHYSLFAKIYFLALHCISFSPCIPQASQEQEAVVGKLYSEKIALENHLEAEQELIMNKLQKQVGAYALWRLPCSGALPLACGRVFSSRSRWGHMP